MAPGRTGLGLQPSLFQSAHGRVILAHMSDEMCEKHIQAFLNRARKVDISWYNSGRLDAELEITRAGGYGIREELYCEPPFDESPPFDDTHAFTIKNVSGTTIISGHLLQTASDVPTPGS